jgi:hypothetical protein
MGDNIRGLANTWLGKVEAAAAIRAPKNEGAS